MKQPSLHDFDVKVRLGGAALLLLATLCLFSLCANRGNPDAQPSAFELCVALVAVCSGCGGAALVFEGRSVFEPASDPRTRRNVHGNEPRENR
ncbi:hypothetical protein [Sphingomonas sp. PAMC 26605]|uniref:hypothetical protein n=1 Tax=Sphingomonas sp. PAMC 26605 TaxID=1112214 RepID=UPI0012F4C240|nr:hypothetical protein [Sphingomonas sp. PAMC 26605]